MRVVDYIASDQTLQHVAIMRVMATEREDIKCEDSLRQFSIKVFVHLYRLISLFWSPFPLNYA